MTLEEEEEGKGELTKKEYLSPTTLSYFSLCAIEETEERETSCALTSLDKEYSVHAPCHFPSLESTTTNALCRNSRQSR